MEEHPCRFDQDLLSRYVSCDCDAEERMRVERHVRICRDCRRDLYELEQTWSLLEEWEIDEAEIPYQPETLRVGLEERFGTTRKSSKWWEVISFGWGWGVLRPIPVAAAVGVLAAILAWWDLDTLTAPPLTRPVETVAVLKPTPMPEPTFVSKPTQGPAVRVDEDVDLAKELEQINKSAERLQQLQSLTKVSPQGNYEDLLSQQNTLSLPFPILRPQSDIAMASLPGRL
ncbi:MAG TPA: zf-HC2 domain-containing protein [bacterium]|nr:zf-HC2 domain-containing protein [bacterium]HQO36540.1 zf-HC2 domain-containing protein [bacterium]HQP99553.1 zf-HC2 domain-containing protein [bacterium]